MNVLKSWLFCSPVEGVKCQHEMSPVASGQNPKLTEVYSSSNSTLPTNISLRKKKWRKTEKQGLASEEELCTQKRAAIESMKHQNSSILDSSQAGNAHRYVSSCSFLRKCLKLSLAVFPSSV